MVDYSNAMTNMHVAVAEKLFRIGNDQVAMLRWKCAISAGGGIFLTRSINEMIIVDSDILVLKLSGYAAQAIFYRLLVLSSNQCQFVKF